MWSHSSLSWHSGTPVPLCSSLEASLGTGRSSELSLEPCPSCTTPVLPAYFLFYTSLLIWLSLFWPDKAAHLLLCWTTLQLCFSFTQGNVMKWKNCKQLFHLSPQVLQAFEEIPLCSILEQIKEKHNLEKVKKVSQLMTTFANCYFNCSLFFEVLVYSVVLGFMLKQVTIMK